MKKDFIGVDFAEHKLDATRYAFISMEESRKKAEQAKQELIQTLKYCCAGLLGVLIASTIFLIIMI